MFPIDDSTIGLAVADYINENSDLDSVTMDVEGFGETDPIASNEDEDGREKNRRVEIVIKQGE